jgi:hypothetical protein
MRKPNSEIYNKYVLNEHDLQAKRTLMIKEKLTRLLRMEFTGKEDVDLFNKNIL